MTPLGEQRKALLGAIGSAGTAILAYYFQGGDLASVQTAVTGLATAVVGYLFVFWTPNRNGAKQ